MGDFGQQLRAAREQMDLSLDQVAETTRIPLVYLQALEDESFSPFTSDLHARGFLRNYASFLNLDADDLLTSYDQVRGKPKDKRHLAAPPPVAQPPQRRSTWAMDALLAVVMVGLLGLAGLTVYQFRNHQEALPTAGPPPTPTVTPMPELEGTAYTMDVVLDYSQHKLDVQERIDYTNATSETLPNLLLNVHPNHSRGTFELNEVTVDMDGATTVPEVFPLDITLRVELPRGLRPDEHVSLFLDYTLNLPKINPAEDFSGGGFGYSKRALSLGNWYPILAPYRDDKGWYGLTYFPVGDPYVSEVADYDVTITTTQGIVIAATGQERHDGNVWHYEAEQARTFAFAASDQYLEVASQAGDVAVRLFHFANNQEAAEVALETAQQAMELYEELYGSYPYSDYRVAETEFAGGMEFTGITFIGSVFFDEYDGTTRTPLIPLVAHEASHQWFYGLVGSDQVIEPWLDESIAEYSAYLYYERFLPGDADWWWNYAVEQWVPTGKIDSLIYEFRDNRGYIDAVYRRGAQFMRDLREAMGDPSFFAMLQEYQRRYAYRLVTSKDFFELVQEYTTADLVPLEDEYFRQRKLP